MRQSLILSINQSYNQMKHLQTIIQSINHADNRPTINQLISQRIQKFPIKYFLQPFKNESLCILSFELLPSDQPMWGNALVSRPSF